MAGFKIRPSLSIDLRDRTPKKTPEELERERLQNEALAQGIEQNKTTFDWQKQDREREARERATAEQDKIFKSERDLMVENARIEKEASTRKGEQAKLDEQARKDALIRPGVIWGMATSGAPADQILAEANIGRKPGEQIVSVAFDEPAQMVRMFKEDGTSIDYTLQKIDQLNQIVAGKIETPKGDKAEVIGLYRQFAQKYDDSGLSEADKTNIKTMLATEPNIDKIASAIGLPAKGLSGPGRPSLSEGEKRVFDVDKTRIEDLKSTIADLETQRAKWLAADPTINERPGKGASEARLKYSMRFQRMGDRIATLRGELMRAQEGFGQRVGGLTAPAPEASAEPQAQGQGIAPPSPRANTSETMPNGMQTDQKVVRGPERTFPTPPSPRAPAALPISGGTLLSGKPLDLSSLTLGGAPAPGPIGVAAKGMPGIGAPAMQGGIGAPNEQGLSGARTQINQMDQAPAGIGQGAQGSLPMPDQQQAPAAPVDEYTQTRTAYNALSQAVKTKMRPDGVPMDGWDFKRAQTALKNVEMKLRSMKPSA